jgi:hypothetical protein
MVTLSSTVPGAPRTETVIYGTTRRPFTASPTIPRDALDDARDLAARVIRDGVTVPYEGALLLAEAIQALDLKRLELEEQAVVAARILDTAHNAGAEYRRQFLAGRDALQALTLDLETARQDIGIAETLRTAALADAEQQRGNAIRLADQVCALIRPPREPVIVHVADLVPPSGLPRVDTPGRCVAAYTAPSDWDTSDLDTVVCDMPMESL